MRQGSKGVGYYALNAQGAPVYIDGWTYPVRLENDTDRLPCIVHRRQDRKTGWQVTHIVTGFRIATGGTKEQAITAARKAFWYHGYCALHLPGED